MTRSAAVGVVDQDIDVGRLVSRANKVRRRLI
jgi:hypothetical protein